MLEEDLDGCKTVAADVRVSGVLAKLPKELDIERRKLESRRTGKRRDGSVVRAATPKSVR